MSQATAAIVIETKSNTAELAPVRKQIETFCESVGFDDRAVGEIGLCVNEAMANVIRHAYHGEENHPIEITAALAEGTFVVSLRDWGDGLKPGPLPAEKSDPLKPGGLGLLCLGRLMDKVAFTPQHPGMLIEMFRKHLNLGPAAPVPTKAKEP